MKFHGENEKGCFSPLSAIFLVDYKHTDMHAHINLMVHVQFGALEHFDNRFDDKIISKKIRKCKATTT